MNKSLLVFVGCLVITVGTISGTFAVAYHLHGSPAKAQPAPPASEPKPAGKAGPAGLEVSAAVDLPPSARREFELAQVITALWLILGGVVLIFFMVVAWRAMRAHERLAIAAERAAQGGSPLSAGTAEPHGASPGGDS